MNNYFENSEIFENFDDEMFSNVVDVGAIVQGAGQITQGAGQFATASATKKASQLEIERLVELQCGKRRGTKKKKAEFDACASPIVAKYDTERLEEKSMQQNQLRTALAQAEQNKKSSQLNLYIGIGVLIVLVGVAVYFKQKS
jgi:uncharacterized phage infection (PIP) family protein YhgE